MKKQLEITFAPLEKKYEDTQHCLMFLCWLLFQFENEFVAHQETKAQLQKAEEKMGRFEAELRAYKCQVKELIFSKQYHPKAHKCPC